MWFAEPDSRKGSLDRCALRTTQNCDATRGEGLDGGMQRSVVNRTSARSMVSWTWIVSGVSDVSGDSRSLAGLAAFLVAAAVAAMITPARRAAAIDPMRTFRHD